jgi:hypothetical protein
LQNIVDSFVFLFALLMQNNWHVLFHAAKAAHPERSDFFDYVYFYSYVLQLCEPIAHFLLVYFVLFSCRFIIVGNMLLLNFLQSLFLTVFTFLLSQADHYDRLKTATKEQRKVSAAAQMAIPNGTRVEVMEVRSEKNRQYKGMRAKVVRYDAESRFHVVQFERRTKAQDLEFEKLGLNPGDASDRLDCLGKMLPYEDDNKARPKFMCSKSNLRTFEGVSCARNETACYAPIHKQEKDRLNNRIEEGQAMDRILAQLLGHAASDISDTVEQYSPPTCLCGKGSWATRFGDFLGVPANLFAKMIGHSNDWGYYGSKYFSAHCWRCNSQVCSDRDCSALEFAPLACSACAHGFAIIPHTHRSVGYNAIRVCLTCREILKAEQRLSTEEYNLLVNTDTKGEVVLEQCFEESARDTCRLTHHIMLDVGKQISRTEEDLLSEEQLQEAAEQLKAGR